MASSEKQTMEEIDMRISVKQMGGWNCYAYCAEEVEEVHWPYFQNGYWWQLGSSFIKTYDQAEGFPSCAENFARFGDLYIRKSLKLVPAPWEKALNRWMDAVRPLNLSWYVHGSAAMALWGLAVEPRNLDILLPNLSDMERVRELFRKQTLFPIERCGDWVMGGGGELFLDAPVSVYFHNSSQEPFDMGRLEKLIYREETIYLSTLEMLKQDNFRYGRPDRVQLIENRLRQR